MDDVLSEVLSSANSLGIAALVSIRPRSQSELAELTGVSVPAVLKHIRRLTDLGLIEERKLNPALFTVRKAYSRRSASVGDFSLTDLKVVRVHRRPAEGKVDGDPAAQLEALAEGIILQRNRIRDQVRRLRTMVDDLLEDQEKLSMTAASAGLGADAGLILQTVYTEEDISSAERVLVRHFGLKGGRRSIDRTLSEASRIAKK